MSDTHTITTFTCDGQTYVPLEDYQRVAMAIEAVKREAYAEGLEDAAREAEKTIEWENGDDYSNYVIGYEAGQGDAAENIRARPNKYGAKE